MSVQDQQEMVIVLDFGGQYSHLIARRIRELKVFCEMLPYTTPLDEIKRHHPRGIVFSGGPASVYQPGAPTVDPAIYDLGIPILGICYGMQLMTRQLGGVVTRAEHHEYGKTALEILDTHDLFCGFEPIEQCWMSHGDRVEAPPPGFTVIARTKLAPVAAMANRERRLYAVQFHPEVIHTPKGQDILRHFLYDVCGCQGRWTMGSFIEESIKEIRARVGNRRALCAISGGVDSSVAAVLVHRAIGDQLTCIFVDHGLLRQGEAGQVVRIIREQFHIPLIHVDASRRFLNRLAGVTDPEQKRKIIGEEFIRVFEEEAARLGQVDFLVQGTLYPDVVESGTATAAVIKSHHNVGGLPEDMQLELIEPLRWLFKDEVRELGKELGLPEEVLWRQPFPGPGLAVRILGEVTPEKLEIVRHADAIVTEEIRRAGLHRQIWQYFAVLPNLRSVGVMGDGRTYAYTVAVRAVHSHDGMTADWVRLPYEVLERISSRIVNEVAGVNRVVYDITSKPPATIEWE
ncbi:glutamine-hydrolyzing GMP synthase [Desulfofundulus thermosubterraneus]|uniref:GMP synthase [glutamine-hydrolyzing] n=1 Tax=Desulfofundulus thermosubterraneus DSM 16057 TaxID=1121432 RepID=A0A1M6IVY8_9FIRM|nr:glutamine-hydrolyzing GMP synthase [Desulfofundulus thermosubterraneus]SHJ38633.1 GMP synthase (glutamine-hydrolysing) [Desulfofundulus thermosubterraneus DSM 16057]